MMWPTMASNVVFETLADWTKGLSTKEARVSIFNHIRDIPYSVIPEIRNPVNGPRELLKRMKGSCSPKHFLLGQMLEMLKIPVKYASYPFSWNIKPAAYPEELRKLAEVVPTEYHLACKVRIESSWVIVDATWDPPLARGGFPINEDWDGSSDTRLAVEPLDEIAHENVQERMSFVQMRKESWTADDHARTDRFIEALNEWLNKVRTEANRSHSTVPLTNGIP